MKQFVIFLAIIMFSFKGYATISYNSNEIIISGTETGNSLRIWLASRSFLATVTNRDITFNRDLKINSNATFTDENSVYHFPLSYRYEPLSNCTVTLIDITIHYSGNAKNHSFNSAYTANFTRVSYLQGVTSGRSDFFNNGNYTFNMSNVSFVSYGSSDYLHFQTPDTLYNITIVNKQGGLNFEPGAVNFGETEVIYDLSLENVSQIVGGAYSQGDFKVYNLNWDASSWNFSQRSVDFHLVNPIKPSNWTAYTGSFSRVKEYYTHDVKLVNSNGDAVDNTNVLLINNYDHNNIPSYSSEYNLISNVSGQIEQQEILKINNSLSSSLRNRNDFTLIVADYLKVYQTQIRTFNNATSDILLVNDDENVTNLSLSSVSAYSGIGIDHSSKEITLSASFSLCDLYDYIKYDKVINNINFPTLEELLVQVSEDQLYVRDYKLILQPGSHLTSCDKFTQIKSDVVSSIADDNQVKVALEDPLGLYKLIQLNQIVSSDILVLDQLTNDTIIFESNYTGSYEFVSQSSSTDILISVYKANYSPWVVGLDFSQNTPIYRFDVYHVEGFFIPGMATTENQEEEIYLLHKILQKSSAILKSSQGSSMVDSIHLTTVSPLSTSYPTKDKQEESISLLKRILTKISVVNKK